MLAFIKVNLELAKISPCGVQLKYNQLKITSKHQLLASRFYTVKVPPGKLQVNTCSNIGFLYPHLEII
jgi:hypothetical protein